ncbi:MAG: helix-turn-helix domain-containing protein, partial [bacterium]|nr:helix-turn-helix domain-containing protein [bacterium]
MKKDTKRLTVDDGLKIQVMVTDRSFTISKIARILKVSNSTISRELQRNCEIKAGYETKCY